MIVDAEMDDLPLYARLRALENLPDNRRQKIVRNLFSVTRLRRSAVVLSIAVYGGAARRPVGAFQPLH
jgi:hypothetical protein